MWSDSPTRSKPEVLLPIRPSHRLDLLLVPQPPEQLPDPANLLARWRERGWLEPRSSGIVEGGLARVRVDRPGRVILYANQQGGFGVTCPTCGANAVGAFSTAVTAWRAGADRVAACDACGERHPLEHYRCAPAAAFGRIAVVLHDVASAFLQEGVLAESQDLLGSLAVVRRRV